MRNLAVRPLRTLVVAVIALTSVTVLASGCGAFDMGNHQQQMHGGSGGALQTPVLSNASTVSVEIAGFDFSPRYLTIGVGTAITWTNRDSAPHDATDRAGAWSTGFLSQSQSAIITFESPGVYEYECTIHPSMKGTLAVEAAL